MSAEDNELDYLHVPRGPVDRAITDLEAKVEAHRYYADDVRDLLRGVIRVLRALDQGKRERW